jgi:LysR family transcriptional regulator, regulator for genes of the gallate degradation pathway
MRYNDFPSLRQLRAFEAVARLQSMSRAAQEINLSQPGVTQSVEALERQLDVGLFERQRSGCYPTKFGSILFPRVQCFFDHLRSALGELIVSNPSMSRQTIDMTNKITKPQIRSLLAIQESESFEAAARRLEISQPSLYRAAKELERELRRGLYQRTARGMTTNSRGSELARRFQVGLREIEYGMEELKAAQGTVVSRIAIGNIPHSDAQILSAAINELLAAHPNACIQVVDGHYDVLLNDLRAARLDLLWGVLRTPPWVKDAKEEELFFNPYVVVARRSHSLARLKRISFKDLAGSDWITPGPTTPRHQALEQMFGNARSAPRITIETTSLQLYRNILASTDRLALMSLYEARLNDPAIFTILPFESSHLRRSDGIVRRADWRPTRIHLQFLDLLRDHANRFSSRMHRKFLASTRTDRSQTGANGPVRRKGGLVAHG